MRRIPLRAPDGSVRAYALVDDEDFERLGDRRWWLRTSADGRRYAAGRIDGRQEYLHRVLMGLSPGDGLQVDHWNRDTLDCRRENLRVTTRAGNAQNTVAQRDAVSRFRGVSWFPLRQLWRARVFNVTVGYRRTELDAALLAEAYRRENMPFAEADPALAAFVQLADRTVAA